MNTLEGLKALNDSAEANARFQLGARKKMRQMLMDFLRCQAWIFTPRRKWKVGTVLDAYRCNYAAKYGRFCGHHRRRP